LDGAKQVDRVNVKRIGGHQLVGVAVVYGMDPPVQPGHRMQQAVREIKNGFNEKEITHRQHHLGNHMESMHGKRFPQLCPQSGTMQQGGQDMDIDGGRNQRFLPPVVMLGAVKRDASHSTQQDGYRRARTEREPRESQQGKHVDKEVERLSFILVSFRSSE